MPPSPGRGGGAEPVAIPDFMVQERPRVIAHRGCSFAAPENTLAAFQRALDLGVDMIELDVQLTRDREVVVFHDATLDRCSDGRGPLGRHTLAELRRLDAGRWFAPEFAGERIPLLADVLELVRDRALLNVEIKAEAVTADIAGGICARTIAAIHDAHATDRVLISSFEPRALEQARQIDPAIPRGSLYDHVRHRGLSPVEIMDAVGAATFHLSRREITPAIVTACRDAGRLVLVYTVNAGREMERLLEMGVAGLFTDRPDVLLELLARRG